MCSTRSTMSLSVYEWLEPLLSAYGPLRGGTYVPPASAPSPELTPLFHPKFKVHAAAWLPAIAYQILTETGSKPPAGTVLARGEIKVPRIRQEFLQVEKYDAGLGVLSFAAFGSKHNSFVENAVVNFLGKIAAESSTRICFKFPCRVPK